MKRMLARHLLTPVKPHWIEWLVVAILVGVVFTSRLAHTQYNQDERHWIGTSYYLEELASWPLASPAWEPSYPTLTHPPVARFIIGAARRACGYRVADLVPLGFIDRSDPDRVEGERPSPALLRCARRPMPWLAAASAAAVFALLCRGTGRVAGYAMLALFLREPYFSRTLDKAMSEGPLVFWTALAALAGGVALAAWARAAPDGRTAPLRPMAWLALAGALAGLAGASKLNGLSVAAGIAGLGLVAPFALRGIPRSRAVALGAAAALVSVASAALAFAVVNPFLLPDPVGRLRMMAGHRVHQIELQRVGNSDARIDGLGQRAEALARRAEIGFPGSWVVSVALGALGVASLAGTARGWPRHAEGAAASLALLFTGAASAVPPLLTPLDWPRYYIFPGFFGVAFMSAGIAWAIARLAGPLTARAERPADG